MTLFGEEIVPEQPKPVAKSKGKKKNEEETQATEAPPPENEQVETPVANEQPAAQETEEITTTPVNETISEPEETIIAETDVTTEPVTETEVIEVAEVAMNAETAPEISAIIETIPDTEPAVKKKRTKVNEENIILPEDWRGDKTYYTIGEVADLFKVKTSHIRFWTNEFKLKVRTTRKGDRLYTPEQIRELRTIHHLVKERGFTLTGAKAKLKEKNNREVHTIDLKQSLQQLRSKLVIIRNQLK